MHIPDGFITGATTAGFGLTSIAGMAIAIRHTGKRLVDRRVPLAGLVAAFVFAAQMFNFPVMPGMSGHLLGGVLAAVLVGPWTAMVILAIVLGTQAIFFADGGLTALGLNTFNLGIVGAGGGYLIYRIVLRAMGNKTKAVAPAAGIAAGLAVPLTAAAFVLQFSLGGAAEVSITAVLVAMVGTHSLIGIGEGILTALVIGTVMETRPDLVFGAPPEAREGGRSVSRRQVLVAGALLTVVFAIVVSQFASRNPDGLEFVAGQQGFADTAQESPASGSPLAGYGAGLTGRDTADTAIAGIVGIAIVLLIGFTLFKLMRRGEHGTPHAAASGHVHALYRHADSLVHRVPAHLKLVAGVGFVIGVVAAPREAFWAFGLYAVVLVAISAAARLKPGFLAKRMLVETPFVAVALLLPFFGGGSTKQLLGLQLSVAGLWTMWNILIKATLGLWAAVVIGSTTPIPDVLSGLERLRLPSPIIAISGFMLRYVDVVLAQFGRMRRAMESRAYRPRSLRASRPMAAAIGALFVRSFERGERVYLAMASRGYTGAMPSKGTGPAPAKQWVAASAFATTSWAIAAIAWTLQ
jgi:cobalt ECF transporter T component CbiQ/cobalamin biosynthesis protein CbiM